MRHTLLIALISVFFVQCGGDSKETDSGKETAPAADAAPASPDAEGGEEEEKNEYAVCIWEKVPMRETPEDKGKYVTTVNLAEKLSLTGESKVDENTAKKREYVKVKLMDGKEGWLVKDFILEKAKAGAITGDVELYARPDLLAKANKTFQKMDIVGVSETQGDWCKIKGKRTGGTWMEEGWIKAGDISYDEKDIAVAVYGKQALAQTVETKKVEELTKITTNKDFQGSVFIADLQSKLDEINGPVMPVEEGDMEGEDGEGDGIETMEGE